MKYNKNSGFTLIELLISSSLFLILVALATGTFIQALKTQRIVTELSESMNNASFVIEQIAREVRVGFGFSSDDGKTLSFTNSEGEDVNYRKITQNGGVVGIGKCIGVACTPDNSYSLLTSPDVDVERVSFILQGTLSNDDQPPRVTILISVAGAKNISINLQTTVSSRILDS